VPHNAKVTQCDHAPSPQPERQVIIPWQNGRGLNYWARLRNETMAATSQFHHVRRLARFIAVPQEHFSYFKG
jgi:hypothetical protein